MRNLLSANFNRLIKSQLLWIYMTFTFILIVIIMAMGINFDIQNVLERDLDYYYFNILPSSALLFAAFISLFLGTEYSDGTMRNKLIVGHTRFEIYCSNLITCIAATSLLMLAWAVGGLIGIPHFGLWSKGITGYFLVMVVVLFTNIALATIFTATSHLISNKATNAVFNIALAFALIICASFLYNALCEPETIISPVTMSVDGGLILGDEIPNPAYVGGTKRLIYEKILFLLPSGQQIWIADETTGNPVIMILFSLPVTVVAAILGYLSFKKKDIK